MSSIPGIFQSFLKEEYKDYPWYTSIDDKIIIVKYDKPTTQTCRNHLLCKGAIFFRKFINLWYLVGEVIDTHDYEEFNFKTLTIKKFNNKYISLGFKTKSEAVIYFGFQPLSEYERRFGMIELKNHV